MSTRTFILAVTGCAVIVACGSYGTSVVEVGNTRTAVASVSVTVPLSLAAGQTARAIATPKDANGTALTDRPVLWYSSSSSIASVTDSGIISAVAPGSTVLSAISEGVAGEATMAVVPPPPTPIATVAVAVDPSAVLIGQTAQATAILADSSGNQISGRAVTWTSSDITVATVDTTTGKVKAIGPGQSMIKATTTGKSNSSRLSVSAPAPIPVASVSVSPLTASLQVGSSVQLSAVTLDSNSNVLTGRVIGWGSSNTTIATVSSSGLVTAVAAGSVSVTASSEGQTASAAITASAPPSVPVASVSVTPATSSLQVGGTAQLSAITRDANNNVLTGRVINWSSSNTGISTVSASGLVTAIVAGSATITALSETKTGTAAITVNAPAPVPVASVSVSPATSSLLVGATVQLTAVTRDANNNVLTGRVITWGSGNTGISTVSASGLVTAIAAGSVTVTALSETKTGMAAITVSAPAPVPVASVSVSPATATLVVGGTVQLSAVTRDANNNILTGRLISWNSSSGAVATVSASGLAKAVAAGNAQITATSEGQIGSATLTDTSPSQPVPPPSGNLNEPAGMTLIAQRSFNGLNEAPWIDSFNANASFISDSSAPRSPTGILRATYPAGFAGGSSPVGNSYVNFAGKRTLYVAFWSRFSANFYGHGSNVNKMAYFYTPAFSGLFVLVANGAGTNPLKPEIRFQNTISDGTSNLLPNLVPTATIPRGQWNLIEVVAVGNTAGNKDGSIDVFLNGVHVTSKAMQWETGSSTWGYFYYYPDWGGTGDTVPYNMWLDWDHAYVSGKN